MGVILLQLSHYTLLPLLIHSRLKQTATTIMINATTPTAPVTSRPCETKFGKLVLKCSKCTETKDDKDITTGYILTLKHESVITTKTAFGTKITPVKHTFYMKVSEPCTVGFEALQDLSIFNIVERPFSFVNDDSEQVEVWCKWLHVPTM